MQVPSLVRIGGGVSRSQLVATLSELGAKKPLLVSDKFLESTGAVSQLTQLLQQHGIPFGVFSDTVEDPSVQVVEQCTAVCREGGYDCVIGFGGGSPIDTAKAVAVCAPNEGRIGEWKVPKQPPQGLPVLAIPTTAGTGSEATKATVITDTDTCEKMLLMGPSLVPDAALVDFHWTRTKPFRLTADTGIDSLTHALEAFVSRKATAVTDAVALRAAKLLYDNLRAACRAARGGDDDTARANMMLGAYLGGVAFSNSSVCLVHGMSRPLGAHFHVPHGLSNAMLLPRVTAFSVQDTEASHKYADMARHLDIASDTVTDKEACRQLVQSLSALNHELEVPTPQAFLTNSLHDTAKAKEAYFKAIPEMAVQALASGSPNNNPRLCTAAQIADLYADVFDSVCVEPL